MRKYLLPKEGRFYKANLHCHTTMSDGCKTAEEVKEIYLKRGYSIVAFTDHNIMIPHFELRDEGFLPLCGFEIDFTEPWNGREFKEVKTCHLCIISLDEKNVTQPCWHRTEYLYGNAPKYRELVKYDEAQPDYIRSYTPECISEVMRIAREKGFFVTYNHPVWSYEQYPEYSCYSNMHALEIMNGNCFMNGYDDYNPRVYDELLHQGKRIFCVAGDDNHNSQPEASRRFDSGWAFTMIKAKALDYPSVAKALENGDFYASEGPEIHELYVEDNTVFIKCSPAQRVIATKDSRRNSHILAQKGEYVTEFSFKLSPKDKYFRVTVVDERGRRACTNAYFTDSL